MRRLLVAALLLAGCEEPPDPQASDVLEIEICPDGGTCEKVADKESKLSVRVCRPEAVKVPAKDLKATLQLSSGRWASPTDSTKPTLLDVPLTAERCKFPLFHAGTTVGPIRVEGQLVGFTVADEDVLRPATIEAIEITPQAKLGENVDFGLAVKVRAKGSHTPSAGTKVAFSVTAVEPPAAATAYVYPDQTVLDDGGAASVKVSVNGAPTLLTITVKATPPDDSEGNPSEPFEDSVTLVAPPPEEKDGG